MKAKKKSATTRFGFKKKAVAAKHKYSARATQQIFHAVALLPGPSAACQAVTGLSNVRYLADEAPMLPLNDCSDPGGCSCTYQHFDDRRTQPRRDSDVGLPVKDHPTDARQGQGRRVTDH